MRAILTLIFTATFIASSAFSDFMGYDQGQVPVPQADPPVQPAGWAFAIWGVIYLGLALSALYGVARRRDDPVWDRVRDPLIVALAAGTPWLEVAERSGIWATALIVVMWAATVTAMRRATSQDRFWLRLPVSLLAGWLTAATLVSLGSTLSGYGIGTPVAMALVMIGSALVAALVIQKSAPEAWAYVVPVNWALFAIAMKNGSAVPSVTVLAAAGIVVLTIAVAASYRRFRAASLSL